MTNAGVRKICLLVSSPGTRTGIGRPSDAGIASEVVKAVHFDSTPLGSQANPHSR